MFHRSVVLWSVCLACICFGCAEKTSSHKQVNFSQDKSSGLQGADVAAAKKVDASTLKIHKLHSTHLVKPAFRGGSQLSGGSDGFMDVDLLVTIEVGAKVQYVDLKICNDKGKSCKKFYPYYSSLRIKTASLPSSLTISASPCVLPSFAITEDICGKTLEISHSLPKNATDVVLQGYAAERAALQGMLEKYDPMITEMVKNYQNVVDECVRNNEQAQNAAMWRMIAGPLLSAVTDATIKPSQDVANAQSSWDMNLTEIRDLMDVSSVTDVWSDSEKLKKLGYGGSAMAYKALAALDAWEKYQKAGQVKDTLKKLGGILGKGNIFGNHKNFNNLLGFVQGPATGSIGGFVGLAASAVFDLFSSYVVLPCAQRQAMLINIDGNLKNSLGQIKTQLCTLEKKINTRHEAIGLEAMETPNCKKSSS